MFFFVYAHLRTSNELLLLLQTVFLNKFRLNAADACGKATCSIVAYGLYKAF